MSYPFDFYYLSAGLLKMGSVATRTKCACLTRLGRFLTKVEQPFLLGRALSFLTLAPSHTSHSKFDSWNKEAEIGSPAYYSKQLYTSGTKCWNGPHRSMQFVITCGTENALLSVMELEKCEYQFTGTSPALCLPLDDAQKDGGAHEEL